MSLSLMKKEGSEKNEQKESKSEFAEFIGYLKGAFDQAVVFHHQTEVYSMHKALNNFYDNIIELTDGLVESTSGIYGRPKGYEIEKPVDYKNPEQVMSYFKDCYEYIQNDRKDIYQESWIQNQVDEIAKLFAETIYQLSLNK